MNPLILLATVAITCALVFYTLGVFSERRAQTLKPGHVALFWLGFGFDTTGTLAMSYIANSSTTASAAMSFHAITGFTAIALMLVHALWATFTVFRGSERAMRIFSRFSIAVWLVWLIPYICGMLVGIPALSLDSNVAISIAVCVSAAIAIIICLHTNIRKHALAKGKANV